MATQTLAKLIERMPSVPDDFFIEWNEWFCGVWGSTMKVPCVNITQQKDKYLLSLAVPGLEKDDFKILVDDNILTVSSEKEEEKDEIDERFTRKEYNYLSFSRSFTLPEEINKEKIDVKYEDGILKISLYPKENRKKTSSKQIAFR